MDCGSDAASFRFVVGKRVRKLAALRSSPIRFAEEKRKLIRIRFRSPNRTKANFAPPPATA